MTEINDLCKYINTYYYLSLRHFVRSKQLFQHYMTQLIFSMQSIHLCVNFARTVYMTRTLNAPLSRVWRLGKKSVTETTSHDNASHTAYTSLPC